METIHRASDSTERVQSTLQSGTSQQRKEAKALKEKMEEEKRKKRSFHDELLLSEELADGDDPRENPTEKTESESDESNQQPHTTDEIDPVDDKGHVDCRA